MATKQLAHDVAALEKAFRVLQKVEFRGETTLIVECGAIHDACRFAKEQLGYIVMCLQDDHRGVIGLSVLVQSNVKSTYELHNRH